jgi:TetR/AcrR family transcriptional regulator, fatty acid metabolism regulator protein
MATKSSRPLRNGDKAGDKRELILEAAATVFAAKGFFGARVSDIAAQAGVADGTIYLYFKGKEEILAALFSVAMNRFLDRARGELASLEGADARLGRLAQFHLEQVGSNRNLAIVFQVELRHSQKFMELVSTTILADYLKFIQQVISQGQEQGLLRPELPASTVAKCFFGMLDEMATNWVLSHRQYRLEDLAPVVTDLFLGGLRAK